MNKQSCITIIKEIFVEYCGQEETISKMTNDQSFEELEIDSISAVKIVVALEDRFDIVFSNDKLDISTFSCFENMAEYILNLSDSSIQD